MSKRDDPGHLNQHLSAVVRAHRLRLKLTLREMDQTLDVPSGTVARVERGDKRLDAQILWKLSKFLGQPVDALFAGAPEIEAEPFMNTGLGITDHEVSEFMRAYRAISRPSARREILSLVRSVAGSSFYRRDRDRPSGPKPLYPDGYT